MEDKIIKYNLQFYEKEEQIRRIDYLINCYSTLFTLDFEIQEELINLREYLINREFDRKRNWKLIGSVMDVPYEILGLKELSCIFNFSPYREVQRTHEREKISILCNVTKKYLLDNKMKLFKDGVYVLYGDLIIMDNTIHMEVKKIEKATADNGKEGIKK